MPCLLSKSPPGLAFSGEVWGVVADFPSLHLWGPQRPSQTAPLIVHPPSPSPFKRPSQSCLLRRPVGQKWSDEAPELTAEQGARPRPGVGGGSSPGRRAAPAPPSPRGRARASNQRGGWLWSPGQHTGSEREPQADRPCIQSASGKGRGHARTGARKLSLPLAPTPV